MKKRNRPTTETSRAGFSARASYRNSTSRLRNMSLRMRALLLLGITVGGAVLGFATGLDPILTGGIAASTATVTAAMMLAPQTLLMLALFAGYAASALIFAPMFAYSAAPSFDTLASSGTAVLGMWIAAVAAFWVSVKFSRRAPWVTYLLALVGSLVFGGILVTVLPSLGLFAAYLTMAAILLWRSFVGEWVQSTFALGYLKVRGWITKDPIAPAAVEENTAEAEWQKRADAERRTAGVLSTVSDITVFHDRQLGKKDAAIPHIIITPAGVIVAASVVTDGPIRETAAFGVEMSDVPVGYIAGTLVQQRKDVAAALKIARKDIALFIVVHSTLHEELSSLNRQVGVFSAKDGDVPSTTLRMLGAEALAAELNMGFETVPVNTRKAITARARMKLRPARPVAEGDFVQTDNLPLGAIDADGNTNRPYAADNDSYTHLGYGVKVQVTTDEGDLIDEIMVAGKPYMDQAGHLLVPLSLSEEFFAAEKEERLPETFPFRVDSVTIES